MASLGHFVAYFFIVLFFYVQYNIFIFNNGGLCGVVFFSEHTVRMEEVF